MEKTQHYIAAAVESLTVERGTAPQLSGPDPAITSKDWRAVTCRSVDLVLADAQQMQHELTAAIDYVAGLAPKPVERATQQRARELVSAAAQRLGRSQGIGAMMRLGHVPTFEHEDWFRIAVEATEQALVQGQ